MTTREEELSAQVAMLLSACCDLEAAIHSEPDMSGRLKNVHMSPIRGPPALRALKIAMSATSDTATKWLAKQMDDACAKQRAFDLSIVNGTKNPFIAEGELEDALAEHDAKVRTESAARIEELEAALRSISTLIVDHEASPTFTASNLAEAVGTARAALAPAGDAKVCETCGKPATCHIGSGEPFTCREHCPDCAGDAKKGTP